MTTDTGIRGQFATVEIEGPYDIRANAETYEMTHTWTLILAAWPSARAGGAWRWLVGRWDIEPDGYRRWSALCSGLAATEARAQEYARAAAPNEVWPRIPYTGAPWALGDLA